MKHVESGFVCGKPRALFAHPTEWSHGNMSTGLSAPRASPVLKLDHLAGRLVYEQLDGILVRQPVGAGDGVVAVLVQGVARFGNGSRAALGGDGVAAHGVDLGDESDTQTRVLFADCDGGPQAGAAAAHDEDIVNKEAISGHSHST